MVEKKWQVYPKTVADLKTQLLINRGFTKRGEQEKFLQSFFNQQTGSTKLFPDLDRAVSRIKQAVTNKELIYIYGDYDVDGITASAILWETINKVGGKVLPYIPSRRSEGYGLHKEALADLAKEGAKVVITVDCGITAIKEAEIAKKLGIDLIITDHHQPQDSLPKPFALIHTTTLAGAGVAFQFASSLLDSFGLGNDKVYWTNLQLATLGTVADMVPLTGDNRIIVKNGLSGLSTTANLGLKALYQEAGMGKVVGTYEIGFLISPRLNAMGRMESALDSLRLLLTRKSERAESLAQKLGQTNKFRQESTQLALAHAKQTVEKEYLGSKFLALYSDTYAEGVVGLVAGRLVEAYHVPTAVIGKGEKHAKGSARSISNFNITEAIHSQADLLISHGGHPMAAGFSIEEINIPKFRHEMVKLAEEQISPKDLVPLLKIDVEIEVSEINEDLMTTLKEFEPFGIGNPEPVFLTRNLEVVKVRTVGKENNHLKLILKDFSARPLEGVGFSLADKKPLEGQMIDIVYNVRENFWNSQRRLEARIKDIKKAK